MTVFEVVDAEENSVILQSFEFDIGELANRTNQLKENTSLSELKIIEKLIKDDDDSPRCIQHDSITLKINSRVLNDSVQIMTLSQIQNALPNVVNKNLIHDRLKAYRPVPKVKDTKNPLVASGATMP